MERKKNDFKNTNNNQNHLKNYTTNISKLQNTLIEKKQNYNTTKAKQKIGKMNNNILKSLNNKKIP